MNIKLCQLYVEALESIACYCSIPKSCLSLCYPRDCVAGEAPLSSFVSWSLLKFMSIESVMLSNHLILCCPLLLLPSIFPSIRVFSKELALGIRWPKYGSFSNSPSSEYLQLISFTINCLDLLAIQGTFKSFLQHHSLKAPILQCSDLFMVCLSYPYTTTGKTITLTIRTFVMK